MASRKGAKPVTRTRKQTINQLKRTMSIPPGDPKKGPSDIAKAVGSRTARSRGTLSPQAGRADRRPKDPDKAGRARPTVFDQVSFREYTDAIGAMITPEDFVKQHPEAITSHFEYQDLYDKVKYARDIWNTPEDKALRDAARAEEKAFYEADPDLYMTERSTTRAQTRVGGTKGSTKVVDRSEAMRRAWATRKKLYGPSGFKDK